MPLVMLPFVINLPMLLILWQGWWYGTRWRLANVIHPYPTTADAIRQCGDLYGASKLTPTVKSILHGLLTLRR